MKPQNCIDIDIDKDEEIKKQKIIISKIKTNSKFLDEINQSLHNKGVDFNERYKIIMDILLKKNTINSNNSDNVIIDTETIEMIDNTLKRVSINTHEIYQMVFMFFGNKYFKRQMDQYYTPITICNFICSLLQPNKQAIEPACGTGDLLNYYKGELTLCDMSKEVLIITKFISENINNNANIMPPCNSLKDLDKQLKKYTYCVMNPPFGCKTVVTDKEILNKYKLGKDQEKVEVGILFIELGLNLLKKDGVLFAIVPNGYLGNITSRCIQLRKLIIENYRLIGVVKLPDNSFKRSGTGVATSILIVQNKKMRPNTNYPIFIHDVKQIGYILNKKNTPIKYKMDNKGYYIGDSNNTPIVDNDLLETTSLFHNFVSASKIRGLKAKKNSKYKYEQMYRNELGENLIFDIKRYLKVYKDVVQECQNHNYKTIGDYCDANSNFNFKRTSSKYKYIDIRSVNTPMYKYNTLSVSELPSRAKYQVQKNDIIISKLKGKISFAIITQDMNNLVVSNGFTVLRPTDETSLVTIFANLFDKSFKIQHQSMVTGSIMETLSDEDIKKIYIKDDIDVNKYNNIIDSIKVLNDELQDS